MTGSQTTLVQVLPLVGGVAVLGLSMYFENRPVQRFRTGKANGSTMTGDGGDGGACH